MTRKDEVGVDIQTHTETVTQPSDTNSLETILQRLDAEMEVTTEDGYWVSFGWTTTASR